MKLDQQTVRRIATLAKLKFEGEEEAAILQALNKIIAFVEKLEELDTKDVEPLRYITDAQDTLREDEVKQEITKAEALHNAPQKDSDYFKVPRVLQKDSDA